MRSEVAVLRRKVVLINLHAACQLLVIWTEQIERAALAPSATPNMSRHGKHIQYNKSSERNNDRLEK